VCAQIVRTDRAYGLCAHTERSGIDGRCCMNEICAGREGQWMGMSLRWCGRVALVMLLALTACTTKAKPSPRGTPNASLHAPSAGNSGTTDTTELAKYATGSALQVVSNGLTDNKTKGLHTQGAPVIDPPHVTQIAPTNDPTTVTVAGCVDDTHWQLYNSSGQM